MTEDSEDRQHSPAPGVWLAPDEWQRVQRSIPVLGVDVLPVRWTTHPRRSVAALGLILRDSPQGRGWCLCGGRVLYGESLHEAIARQIRDTFGAAARFETHSGAQPLYVAQYAPAAREVRGFDAFDPRQHAIGLTFAVTLTGALTPRGEAHDFNWFPADQLPAPETFGFGQGRVVEACLRALRAPA